MTQWVEVRVPTEAEDITVVQGDRRKPVMTDLLAALGLFGLYAFAEIVTGGEALGTALPLLLGGIGLVLMGREEVRRRNY